MKIFELKKKKNTDNLDCSLTNQRTGIVELLQVYWKDLWSRDRPSWVDQLVLTGPSRSSSIPTNDEVLPSCPHHFDYSIMTISSPVATTTTYSAYRSTTSAECRKFVLSHQRARGNAPAAKIGIIAIMTAPLPVWFLLIILGLLNLEWARARSQMNCS